MEQYVYRNHKKLRCGWTTGSCAAAAAGAAVQLLLTGEAPGIYDLMTPAGVLLHLPVEEAKCAGSTASCAVRKNGGDDIDVTDGLLVFAQAEKTDGEASAVEIAAGGGIGRVTKPGLDQPPGSPAINAVPKEMIRREVRRVCRENGCQSAIRITLSVPGGLQAAARTFNPRLGIEGGISIIGTTGIVEPMSRQALLDTIRVELQQRRACGQRDLLIVPGRSGLAFMQEKYGIAPQESVLCSNFVGDTLDMALDMGYQSVLLAGHIGKLVKLGAGIMNTHSHVADGRMETLAACGVEAGAETKLLQRLFTFTTTEEALDYLIDQGIWESVFDRLLARIARQMDLRVRGEIKTAAILFCSRHGYLGRTEQAGALLEKLKERQG